MAIKNTQGLVIAQALRFDCETHETTMTMVGDGDGYDDDDDEK